MSLSYQIVYLVAKHNQVFQAYTKIEIKRGDLRAFQDLSHAKKCLSTWLRGDIDDIVGISEAVEAGSRALSVRAHVLKVEPVPDIQGVVEADRLSDVINAIASRPEDAVLDPILRLARRELVVNRTLASAKHLRNRVLVIKHDAREVAVDPVVEVDHVTLLARSWAWHCAARNDVAGQGECGRDVVAAWLSDHVDVDWDVLVESLAENNSHGLEVLAGEAASDIDGVHLVSEGLGLVHDGARIANCLEESQWVSSTRSDVEADSDNVQAKLLGDGKQLNGRIQRSAKLHAETAQAGCVIGDNADEQLSVWEELLDLVELIGVIECHLLNSVGGGVADVGVGLARLSIDNAVWGGAHFKNLLDLGLGSTVETGAQSGEQTEDLWVWVALYRCASLAGVPSCAYVVR